MVKLGRAKEQNRAASAPTSAQTSSTSLICYICGASNANWPAYSRIRSPPNTPFFPFLDYHDPPPGCRSMDRRSGRVDACTVCFSFLTQQWHAYEASDTPLIKRLYWLKRSGMDPSSEKKDTSEAGNKAVSAEELDKALRDLDEERNLEASSDVRDESEIHGELKEGRSEDDEKCDSSSVVQDGHAARSSCTSTDVAQTPEPLETCFICGREKAKEFVRSVHTRPQLKTETPFYPCLACHTPVSTARKIDYLGKALVCEACQKFLFRQWQVFQKNSTPLGERQYQLRSDPSLPREQQSQLSTMVCFICGVNQPATSGRFLYSLKHTAGEPYYPFLGKLAPPSGAMPLTQQGLTRVCSGCHKSLHRQWKRYEADGVDEENRRYHIRNETVVHDKGSVSDLSAVACYACGRSCSERDLCHLYTKPNTNPSTVSLFFPSIANLKSPPDAQPIDQTGWTLVCKECHGCLEEKWFAYEKKRTPLQDRVYDLRLTKKQTEVCCFLCGAKCKACQTLLLYSYPQSGEGVEDGGPFFPFLSTCEPAPNAQAVDPHGAVATCEICFANMMAQWQVYESSSVPEENNRWLRKYHVTHVVCYLCGTRAHRSSSSAVNKLLITFSKNHQPPRGAISVDRDRVVLCPDCQGAVKSDLEAMEDRKQFGQGADKLKGNLDFARDEIQPADPVIVIDSSDSENEPFARLRAKRSSLSVPTSHANEPPMHYTTSASPGVHQALLQNKDCISSVSPTSSMRSSSNRHSEASFAAALRNLAKQAVTPLSHSPASSNSGSQSPSPAVSAPTGRNTGMSPSRSSPAARSTPPSSSFLDSKSKDKRELQHQVAGRVRSPSAAPNTLFEPEHRNQTPGDPAHDSSRGPLGPEMGLQHRVGHQVMPGVYSTKSHSGAPHEVAMLSERYPPNHPPPHMAYYMHHGGKPEVPVFVPRGVPGPPPLLASKRDGLEHSAVVHPFYPGPYRPPHVLDPNDLAFPTWRQQRAAEHLRQQHDRQVHFGDGYPEPFDRQVPHGIEPDRHIPLGGVERHSLPSSVERHAPPSVVEHYTPRNESPRQRTEDTPETDNRKQEGPKGAPSSDSKSSEAGGKEPGNEKAGRGEKSDSMPMIRQVYYYDSKNSCPVHGHSTGPSRTSPTEPPRSHPSHGPPPGSDPLPTPKPGRPDEYNRMFLPPLEAPLLHPYLVHHPQDAPYSVHPLEKRQAEYFREQGRQQELYFHQHALRDQKDQMKAREEDWHHQQQQLAQETEAGRDPRERGRYSHHMHRQELEHRERARKSPFNVEPHKADSPLERQNHRDREFYRTYSLQPFYTPHAQDGSQAKSFGDHYPRGVEPHVLRDTEGRHILKPSHGMQFPVGRFPAGYQDPYPFFRPATSMADRPYGGAGAWHRTERAVLLNGDYPPDLPRPQAHRGDSSEIARRIKVERTEEDSSTRRPVLKIRHSPSKLRFLEGLGLVTVDKKQELSRGEPGMKRKCDDNRVIENDEEGVENKENESPVDVRAFNDRSAADSDTAQSRAEKLEFMAMLGLVPPSQRQELEKCYEVKRSERKTRKVRSRPLKRARRDGEADRDSDNSQGSNLDVENATGPMTRQKQQLMQEQGVLQEQRKSKESRMDIGKELSVHVKSENTDKPSSPFSFEHRDSYRGNNTDQYRNSLTLTSSERHSSHVPPRLTLQSLTNMEDPFSNLSASTFRPPYLRHTGLLSISQDLAALAPPTQHEPRSVSQPVRPEPLRSMGLSMSEQLSRDYLSQRPQAMGSEFSRQFAPQGHAQQRPGGLRSDDEQTSREHVETEQLSPCDEGFRWPGVETVMQAYLAHATERNVEVRVLRDNAEQLQVQQQSLNEEAQRLTVQIQNLAHAKSDQAEDSKKLLERLHSLHYFVEGFQR